MNEIHEHMTLDEIMAAIRRRPWAQLEVKSSNGRWNASLGPREPWDTRTTCMVTGYVSQEDAIRAVFHMARVVT